MYIPATNIMDNPIEIIAFMKRFSFATIISNKKNIPIATHLPFIIEKKEEDLFLISHFAKANDHWQYIENQSVLVIFSEPHAYISTTNYDAELNVPTWNYLSVHAYGQVEIIAEDSDLKDLLQKTIENYEHSFNAKWDNFPVAYKEKLMKGIVGFKLKVTDLQAKKKISQNRTETEKTKIITTLSKSEDANANIIADYMENEKKQNN